MSSTSIPVEAAKISGATYSIPSSRIEPDPDQPRKAFDPEYIASLGESIKAEGLRQPITVRKNPDRPGFFFIITGECRWRAHCHAGVQLVKCAVATDCEDSAKRFRTQVIENKGRRDMSLREDAFAAKRMTENGDDDKTIAVAMCLSVHRMRNVRAMSLLSDAVWTLIDAGMINAGVAEYAAGTVPAERVNELLMRCVGKTRKQAAAIIYAFEAEMNQSAFELDCQTAGVLEKKSDMTKQLAVQLLSVMQVIEKLNPNAQAKLARQIGVEVGDLVPKTRQAVRGAVFIQRVMNSATLDTVVTKPRKKAK
jgi:ParB family chromosome partitioning protein